MKPKREITLGEMQDECKRINGTCVGLAFVTEDCKYKGVCPFQMQSRKALAWDLTDPPRFTEAQMALFRWWYECGATWAGLDWDAHVGDIVVFRNDKEQQVGNMQNTTITGWFKDNETFLDLAELFGKEARDAN